MCKGAYTCNKIVCSVILNFRASNLHTVNDSLFVFLCHRLRETSKDTSPRI